MNRLALSIITLCTVVLPALAGTVHEKRIKFDQGKDHTTTSGTVAGDDTIVYKLGAKDGQFLKVDFEAGSGSVDYNIYIPGKGMGDEALFTSATGGRAYQGQLYKSGDHTITVFLNRNAARKGQKADYKMRVAVTNKAPGAAVAEEKPATGKVPQKVIDDCLTALRKQVGNETGMKVISAKRGEASFIIDVRVDSAEKPWRCFHDGTKCTGTEYQGEG